MKIKRSFTVTNPRIIFELGMILVAFFVVFVILNTIFAEPPHLAMYVCAILFVFLPCSIVMLWSKLFKVTVKGNRITVRKGTGKKYSFDVSEIVKVDWKIVETKMGKNEKITIRTASKHFSVETLMNGFNNMSAYIVANVDSGVDELTRGLQARGYNAAGIHGDLSQGRRMNVLKRFKQAISRSSVQLI